jgi:putative flippase GtrA
LRQRVINFIEFFHLPLFQFIPTQTFRYLFCGVSTIVTDWVAFYLAYHFIFTTNINVLSISITPETCALAVAFLSSFVWGFALNKYVVFTDSAVKGRIQLFRYGLIVATCIIFNYFLMRFFIHQLNIYPTFSRVITSLIVAVYSYIIQRKFTFKSE